MSSKDEARKHTVDIAENATPREQGTIGQLSPVSSPVLHSISGHKTNQEIVNSFDNGAYFRNYRNVPRLKVTRETDDNICCVTVHKVVAATDAGPCAVNRSIRGALQHLPEN
ncbi:MAG: hypothetical protein ACLQG3_07845 [Terracidiphilus sp.]